jgi:hypothetical protein
LTREVAEDWEMNRFPTMTGQIKASMYTVQHIEVVHDAQAFGGMVAH